MRDLLPGDADHMAAVVAAFEEVAQRGAFRTIATPLIESTPLFVRSLGDDSDVVAKEMFHVVTAHSSSSSANSSSSSSSGKGGEALTLRPEGTAGVIRALVSSGRIADLPQRCRYVGPMFRHERPQRGRYRQFTQCGIEAVGQGTQA